jgi:hypothetical protein
MSLVVEEQVAEEQQADINSQDFILGGTNAIVESYDIIKEENELIEERMTCKCCPFFLLTPGYCSDTGCKKGVAMSPRYHCDRTETVYSLLEVYSELEKYLDEEMLLEN